MKNSTKVTLYQILTCDSGGCGRYLTDLYFLDEESAKKRLPGFGGYGCVDKVDATVNPKGEYQISSRKIYLADAKESEAAAIKAAKAKLTEYELWLIQNR